MPLHVKAPQLESNLLLDSVLVLSPKLNCSMKKRSKPVHFKGNSDNIPLPASDFQKVFILINEH